MSAAYIGGVGSRYARRAVSFRSASRELSPLDRPCSVLGPAWQTADGAAQLARTSVARREANRVRAIARRSA